ncbi:GNAT family N-acetyltransferase [Roseateles oligotrophus]|uniref:GNAT family N-acetyltransferase n=1 Tax=Roseateles oligotrophus TaxID=1769250 RepID=A0ABT2Y9M8_9BURK|nr:GNAT family N-acetyltransferase [Roseateles oligotrophus]MCV2367004.1 GNAT family N-acetyltransferase [Roseateles oligotrophus]
MRIEIDDLTRPAIHALLNEHLAHMNQLSPPEQVFALDLSKLQSPDITFLTVWDDELLLGCGALKALGARHGEIKSMRTPASLRGRGAGRAVLHQIIEIARQRGYDLLSLETGTHPEFSPAHRLYKSAGFQESGPFANYKEDPHSMFMELRLPEKAV